MLMWSLSVSKATSIDLVALLRQRSPRRLLDLRRQYGEQQVIEAVKAAHEQVTLTEHRGCGCKAADYVMIDGIRYKMVGLL